MQRYHSIILLASCDADYRFTFVDVGSPGSDGDMNVLSRSSFGISILQDNGLLNLPRNSIINDKETPFFFVADDAFPLTRRIMKPFGGNNLTNTQRIFNYRLSRARRTIENAFGILVNRWACLQSDVLCQPDKAKIIVSAYCALHNFLINRRCKYITDVENEIDAATDALDSINSDALSGTERAKNMRERIASHLETVYTLPWQIDSAHCS